MPPTPYDRLGGREPVARLVDRFYDLMEGDPAFTELRAMHAADLAPMRESLTGFLTMWLGGPREWSATRPGVCMMSAHAGLPIDRTAAIQWITAMERALIDTGVEQPLRAELVHAFAKVSAAMVNRRTREG
ncbi:MAG: group II truncated hemoglobin [Alphaproteobacteria bacterium]|nr:group II truncated hemoglobin [Alphaproteobacteria bacterium]